MKAPDRLPAEPLDLAQGRFARFEAVEWWDQARLRAARVLVIGAGALGNEVLKNLALLGVGHVAMVDMDCIEMSNLSRSVLFRETDEGQSKAARAAAMMREICPDITPLAIVGNVLSDVGLGWFRWAEVVVGALDNREARVFVNSVCAQLGRFWIDGGIEVLNGIVRGFAPPATACYECTMSAADWEQINRRRSCSMLARRAIVHRGTPTAPTTASVIGGMQAQEVVKHLHGLETLRGRGYFFEGLTHSSFPVSYPRKPDCPWHEPAPPILSNHDMTSQTPFHVLALRAEKELGGLDAIDVMREIVRELECPACGARQEIWQSEEKVPESRARCGECGSECVPVYLHSIAAGDPLMQRTAKSIGLPPWDIVWARFGEKSLGMEISGDNPFLENKEANEATRK
jgi:adenylyltransferase/sulfurtransferase